VGVNRSFQSSAFSDQHPVLAVMPWAEGRMLNADGPRIQEVPLATNI
jgi:hypothetical protein